MDQFNFVNAQADYTKVAVDEVYTILTNLKNPWTAEFTKVKKLMLIDKLINYYTTEYAEYEKCAVLSVLREKVLNESKYKNRDSIK